MEVKRYRVAKEVERIIATPQWEEVMMMVKKTFVYDMNMNCMDKAIRKTECNKITQDNSEKAVDVAASFFAQIFFVALSLTVFCAGP